MPELDAERLEVADTLRRALAIENELSRPQARAYVRCLQTTWQVPTIQWAERESFRQLADARRWWTRYLELDQTSDWARTAARGIAFADMKLNKSAG